MCPALAPEEEHMGRTSSDIWMTADELAEASRVLARMDGDVWLRLLHAVATARVNGVSTIRRANSDRERDYA